jgi:hypothetical protein
LSRIQFIPLKSKLNTKNKPDVIVMLPSLGYFPFLFWVKALEKNTCKLFATALVLVQNNIATT